MAKQPVDLELKKAFTELQLKMLETTQKLKIADAQIDGLKRNIQYAQLTEKEIAVLPSETKTYESVGRMFLMADITEVRSSLASRVKTYEEKIKTLEGNKNYLERSLKDSENNLREMVQQRKEMATSNEST